MELGWLGLVVLVALSSCEDFGLPIYIHTHQDVSCSDTGNETLLRGISRYDCVLQCMRQGCHLFSYKQQEDIEDNSTCVLTELPCVVLEDRPGFVSHPVRTSPDSECLQWEPYVEGAEFPSRFVEISSTNVTTAIVRFPYEGALLPGIISNTTSPSVYSVHNNQSVSQPADSTVDFLTVQPNCSLLWLPHDATELEPLPPGALIAGRKQHGAPLYLARSLSTPQVQGNVVGYYDPQSSEVYFEPYGIFFLKEIDILCVA